MQLAEYDTMPYRPRALRSLLAVFAVFSVVYLHEQFRWNYLVGFGLITVGVFFIFKKW